MTAGEIALEALKVCGDLLNKLESNGEDESAERALYTQLSTAAVYADRLVIKLGRRTYIEEQLHRLGL